VTTRLKAIAVLAAVVFLVSGCQYLNMFGATGAYPVDPLDPGDFGSFDPDGFPMPSPMATFTTGSATLTIDGETTTLDQLSGFAGAYDEFGTEVGWTDGAGTYVRFFGSGDAAFGDEGFVTIDRIRDGQHRTSNDPWVCEVELDKSDSTGVAGTASCDGMHWMDALGGGFVDPTSIEVGPAFDAEIAFSATP
jgi:hypothetical protein